MAKKGAKIIEINIILERQPRKTKKEFIELVTGIKALIDASQIPIDVLCKKLKMDKTSLYRRFKSPAIWNWDELDKLFDILGI